MKKLLIALIAAFALGGTGVYAADGGGGSYDESYHQDVNQQYSWLFRLIWSWINHVHDRYCGHGDIGSDGDDGSTEVAQVPELDASGAMLALLLLGGLMMLRRETSNDA